MTHLRDSIALTAPLAALALLALAESMAAQAPNFADVRTAALKAMGGQEVARLEYSGTGWDACLGQAWKITEGWARWELQEYRRIIDYAAATSLQTAKRRAAMDPGKIGGCGAQPGAAAANQQTSIAANAGWSDQLPIWLTPHGFLALGAQTAPVVAREGRGVKVTIPLTRAGIRYTVNGVYGADYLLERVETWIDDPVFGDMKVEARFSEYRDFGGVRFPASIIYTQGGFPTLNMKVTAVVPNTDAVAAPPARGEDARLVPLHQLLRRTRNRLYYKIADGIFVFSGGYQSTAVEFSDYAVLIDGMESDARVRDLIRLTHQAIPNKPIRYVVNTHSHFDHASGLRLLAAEGATVLTHETNRAFFERALNTPRTLTAGATPTRKVVVQGIRDRHVISDKTGQSIELHALQGGLHAADMLIAYLPRARAIVESDLLQPWINPVFGGGRTGPHPYLAYLFDELARLRLDYDRFVPVHRPPAPPTMTKADLLAAVGRAQLPAPNAAGIAIGHMHLIVPDVAQHLRIWTLLGGQEKRVGDLSLLAFPGVYLIMTAGTPIAPSSETAINHVGFSVRDYADYKAKLQSVGATFVFDSAENGQMIVDLPGGVRVEIIVEREQTAAIVFHHAHLSAVDGAAMRDWYVRVFGAEPGERRNLPSAVVPGGRLDFLPVRGEAPRPSKGAAIDHIGFEASDLDAFVRRLQQNNVPVERPRTFWGTASVASAFLTDPSGAFIEITKGLADLR